MIYAQTFDGNIIPLFEIGVTHDSATFRANVAIKSSLFTCTNSAHTWKNKTKRPSTHAPANSFTCRGKQKAGLLMFVASSKL